jgi:hypothetical protein
MSCRVCVRCVLKMNLIFWLMVIGREVSAPALNVGVISIMKRALGSPYTCCHPPNLSQ